METFVSVIEKLTKCISTAVNEGKSVTAVNKKFIGQVADEISRATLNLQNVIAIANSSTPSLGELKEEIVACVYIMVKTV